MKILFLCTANVQRSSTAQEIFQAIDNKNEYKSAGLSKKYVEKNETTLCTEELLCWADKIYVFEKTHVERIIEHTAQKHIHKITNLRIDDRYEYFQRELVLLLLKRLSKEQLN